MDGTHIHNPLFLAGAALNVALFLAYTGAIARGAWTALEGRSPRFVKSRMSRALMMIAVMMAVAVPFAASARGHGSLSAGTEMASGTVTPAPGNADALPAPSPAAVITRVLPTPTPDLTASTEDSGSNAAEYIVIGFVLSVLGLLVAGLLVAWWVVGR